MAISKTHEEEISRFKRSNTKNTKIQISRNNSELKLRLYQNMFDKIFCQNVT